MESSRSVGAALSLVDVSVTYGRRSHATDAVRSVSLAVAPGECLGIVGESGSGKSTLGRVMCGLERPSSGAVLIGDTDISSLKTKELRRLRSSVQIVFQDSLGSFNPRMTLGMSISEPLRMLTDTGKSEIPERVGEALKSVGLGPELAHRYPSEVSGGQRQRCGIARALVVDPRIVIFDEPVSALDLVSSERILELIAELTVVRALTSVLISHDLSAVARCAHRTLVLKDGSVVEVGETSQVLARPHHDYTKELIDSVPLAVTSLASTPEQRR